jgi:Tfp pilus assembly protein PilV
MSMKNLFHRRQEENNQAGIASILVTMIMMVVLSLIVLGFATLSRREQTNSLNTQLSSQAFYAAETGVNDAQQAVSAQLAATGNVQSKTDCGAEPSVYSTLTANLSQIDPVHNVSYSCLLINPAPPSLLYNDIGASSTVIPINANNGLAVNNLTLQWRAANEDATNATDLAYGCPTTASQTLPSSSSWVAGGCGYGMLRVEVVPTDPADLSSAALLNNEMTFFLSPVFGPNPATTVIYTPCAPGSTSGKCGAIIADQCNDGGASVTGTYCQATITNLGATNYALRVQSLYNDSSLTVTPDSNVSLTGAQVLIDSTGQANSVFRRIQVRFSLTANDTTPTPDEAIEAGGSICKRYVTSTASNSYADYTNGVCGGAQYITPPPPGNAGVSDCKGAVPPPGCPVYTPGPPGPTGPERVYYDVFLVNTSNNPGKTVVGCTWNWGDGTTTSGGTISPNGTPVSTGRSLQEGSCLPAENIGHCYPYVKRGYTITLTEYLSSGPPGTTRYPVDEPGGEGTDADSCSVLAS